MAEEFSSLEEGGEFIFIIKILQIIRKVNFNLNQQKSLKILKEGRKCKKAGGACELGRAAEAWGEGGGGEELFGADWHYLTHLIIIFFAIILFLCLLL